MTDDPNAPYGENTIEGVLLDDVERAFDHDDINVVATGRAEHDIDIIELNLNKEDTGETKCFGGVEYPIISIVYEVLLPASMSVQSGEDVRVTGFECNWIFTDIQVDAVEDDYTVFTTEYIERVA